MKKDTIKVMCPQDRPALSMTSMYAYADKNKIEIPHLESASPQMVFGWISECSRLTQPELYDEIVIFGEKLHV